MPFKDLLKLAADYGVDELVLPDVMGDAAETRKAVDEAIDIVLTTSHKPFKLQAVVQGRTQEEVDFMVQYYQKSALIDVIALPRIINYPLGAWARVNAMERMVNNELPQKEVHCLGASTFLEEVHHIAQQGIARSLDTSAPIVMSQQGKSIREGDEYKSYRDDAPYIDWIPSEEEMILVKENVKTYAELVR